MRPAVFLDRDGTLVEEVPYLHDPAALVLLPGVAGALAALGAAGYALVVVTNQAGVARGYYGEAAGPVWK
jgi:D-glycero-D-manno-heptose 1,7-bisphosphate phosphatase